VRNYRSPPRPSVRGVPKSRSVVVVLVETEHYTVAGIEEDDPDRAIRGIANEWLHRLPGGTCVLTHQEGASAPNQKYRVA
jgi:hypothetical protein